RFHSPFETPGDSTGKPPASRMPRLTCSASLRKWALQGVSSDQVLQMPMIGLPWNSWSGMPWFFIQLRYMKPFLSWVPNHAAERSSGLFFVFLVSDTRPSIDSAMRGVYGAQGRLSNQI